MNELTQFQAMAANIALKKCLYSGHFSVCDLRELAKLIGVELGGQDYQALQVLHGVASI